jgi:hypothetical protein
MGGCIAGFAALPKLPEVPAKILQEASLASSRQPIESPEKMIRSTEAKSVQNDSPAPSRQSSWDPAFAGMTDDQLRAFHANLDSRLQPFWSSVLQRRIAIAIYTIPLPPSHHPRHSKLQPHKHDDPTLPTEDDEPLLRSTLSTDAQGQFSQKIVVPWERICSHPPSLKMAFSPPPPITGPIPKETEEEAASPSSDAWGIYIRAELLAEGAPNQLPPSATGLPPGQPAKFSPATSTESPKLLPPETPSREDSANAFFSSAALPVAAGSGGAGGGLLAVGKTAVQSSVVTPIAGSQGVRVISDLDDTIKTSDILSGARQVFR